MFPTIIQAPMAGGATTPELVHAVSEAGGLGFLAGGYLSADQLEQLIEKTRLLGTASFGVNLFVPNEEVDATTELKQYETKMKQLATGIQTEAGALAYSDDDWDKKLRLLLSSEVPFASFTFGCPSKETLQLLKANHTKTIVTVTTLAEAEFAINEGADALCVQGIEAGGHRASFQAELDQSTQQPLRTLLAEIKPFTDIPLIASGGIMDGSDIKDVLALGASAVQLGTAFLCCPESGASVLHKESLQNGMFQDTALTHAYTGRPARGLANAFMRENKAAPLAYPQLHFLTQPIRKKAVKDRNTEVVAMWAGVNFQRVRAIPAGELVGLLYAEVHLS